MLFEIKIMQKIPSYAKHQSVKWWLFEIVVKLLLRTWASIVVPGFSQVPVTKGYSSLCVPWEASGEEFNLHNSSLSICDKVEFLIVWIQQTIIKIVLDLLLFESHCQSCLFSREICKEVDFKTIIDEQFLFKSEST